jgi:hypothetical protein
VRVTARASRSIPSARRGVACTPSGD